jgi:hypothetical protein
MMLEEQVGPIRHTLEIPALDQAGYRQLYRLVTVPRVRRRFSALRFGIFIALCCVLGVALSYGASRLTLTGQAWIGRLDIGEGLSLNGIEMFLCTVGVVLLTILAVGVALLLNIGAQMRRLHQAMAPTLAPHRLSFGDRGVIYHAPGKTSVLDWSRVEGLRQGQGITFLVVDGISAFWLPEAVLARYPDRVGLMSLITAGIARKG